MQLSIDFNTTTPEPTRNLRTLAARAKQLRNQISILTTVYNGAKRRGDEQAIEQTNAKLWLLHTELKGVETQLEAE